MKKISTETWINPTGGYGDILMLSGVLKKSSEINPRLKLNMVRRAIYSDLFKDHPAIKKIGYPPKDANIITTDYWSKEKIGKGNQRPYQILSRLFGIPTPAEEILYLPGDYTEDRLLHDFININGRKVAIIAPSSVSPRKTMHPVIWHDIVDKLEKTGFFIIQVGHKSDIYIKGAYSLLGVTTIRQLIALLVKSDVIISVDNFVMHAAHLIAKPAIVIWGPTRSTIYGYPEQVHIQCPVNYCQFRNKCLGADFPDNYNKPCPLEQNHCMNKVSVEKVVNAVIKTTFSQDFI